MDFPICNGYIAAGCAEKDECSCHEIYSCPRCAGTGAAKNTELYRRGELPEESAIRYVTCAILYRRGQSFDAWEIHAPAVRKALRLCIHELEPDVCKICNGRVKELVEEGTA